MPSLVLFLPAVNASLNGVATVLLITGYLLIRRRRVHAHRACMLAAFGVSALFLVSYLTYHAYAGSKPFPPLAYWRPFYLTILLTHVILAAAVPLLALGAVLRALQGRFDAHRRIARIAYPVWLYVSVTGVVIYGMLYHLAPRLVTV